jgi:phage-related protein
MTQPTFAFPCEYNFTVARNAYSERVRFSLTASGATPSTDELGTSVYEIKTIPVDNEIASALDSSLQSLRGNFFYSQFYFDDSIYKYKIIDDTWEWQVIGPTANVFTFQVERLFEPILDIALAYEINQSESVLRHFFRIATSSGTAAPSIVSNPYKTSTITTRPVSRTVAKTFRDAIASFVGATFYTKLYLDDTAKLYRIPSQGWSITGQGGDSCVFELNLEEVVDTSSDIPCSIQPLSSKSINYGQRIKIAASSGTASPSASGITISEYSINTAPISLNQSSGVAASLSSLAGSFFYSKLPHDASVVKYALIDDEWSRELTGNDSVVFTFNIRQVYEPTVEFAIDYGQSQEQQVSAHIFRIATASGTATPATTSRALKTASVQTRPMAKAAAAALETTLLGLNGAAFYSQIYLDSAPRLYRLQPYQWSWTPDGEDAYVCAFTMAEVIASATDIPCVDTLNLERTSRVKMVQFGDGYQQFAPDGINTEDYRYSIETLPLSDTQSAAVEAALSALKGNIFYAKFKNDSQVYKYRLDDNRWSWQSSGQNANVFTFTVKRAYDL